MKWISDNPVKGTAVIAGLALLTGLAVGLLAVPAALRALVRREAVGFATSAGANLAFQTFTEDSYLRLLRDGAPDWAKGYFDRGVIRAVKERVDRGWDERFRLLSSGDPSAAALASYWKSTGILDELGLPEAEAACRIDTHPISPASTRAGGAALAGEPEAARLLLDPPSPSTYRLPGEFEPIESVIVSFPILYPGQWKTHAALIGAIADEARALVLVPNPGWARAVGTYLEGKGLAMANVEIVQLPTDDVWTRDYGPTTVLGAEGGRFFVWNPYYEEYTSYQRHSADAGAALGARLGLPVLRLPLVVEGGNIIADGQGTLIMFDSVLANNPDLDRAGLERIMAAYYGCKRLILLPSLAGELTGHVDMVVKFADANTLLVNRSPASFKWHGDFERIAETLAALPAADGKPYRILRVDMPVVAGDDPAFPSYINSLTLNGSVIVPVYGKPEDVAALEVYRRAMGGRRVVGVDFSGYPVGAVHCQTKEVYAAER